MARNWAFRSEYEDKEARDAYRRRRASIRAEREPEERIISDASDCPDCGRRGVRTSYQIRMGYHCDTCTRNVETSGGIYGF